ncbi:sigma-70 family RNA polymerase sigma factor [Bradyrhizobium stylosanthis]|uniref:RNA polymerase ECF family sigma subunit n=1 Tax=Bradyrhizobium stylosanthis TaxID=1803665 RepID=A0A560DJG1_9BRAD|nr:sigma-70 family RNA polymerase sigma factor [Bradyrhizobium stylosanthis]TWA97240.1 RNA polymerase ECF family sigma subunit [Bradyrhizobium stylosanthis]
MTNQEAELKALMIASQRGDAAAYRVLLSKLVPRLRGYYKRRLTGVGRSADEAEDLLQETLLAVHLKRHTYDPEALFTPWLQAIARYKLIDHLRSTKASRMDVPIEDHLELSATDDHAAAEGTHDMTSLLARLPLKTRQAIEAVKLEGKSVAETAERYGMSESNVKVSIHRGLKALASFLRKDSDT